MNAIRCLMRLALAAAYLPAVFGCATVDAPVHQTSVFAEEGLRTPVGIALLPTAGPNSDVLIADSGNNRIVRLNAEGRLRDAWGGQGGAPGQFRRPLGVAVGPRGRVYVADYLNDRVQMLDSEGQPLEQWSAFADGDRLNGPADLAFDSKRGVLHIVDFGHDRVVASTWTDSSARSSLGRYWY